MLILLGFGLLLLVIWAGNVAAKRRRAEERLRVVAAYAAGLSGAAAALPVYAPPPATPAPSAPPSHDLPFAGNRVRPTPESRRLGYWGHPPCETVAEDEIHRRLAKLSGAPPEICFTGLTRRTKITWRSLRSTPGFGCAPMSPRT